MELALIIGILSLGVGLIALEVFVIPGFGAAGVTGGLTLFAGVGFAWYSYGAAVGVGALVISATFSGAAITTFLRTRAGKRMVLETTQTSTAFAPGAALRFDGREGVTVTPLRPSGAVDFGGEHVDTVTDGLYLDAGVRVRVVRVEGARIVVEPLYSPCGDRRQ